MKDVEETRKLVVNYLTDNRKEALTVYV